jgi:hypothetical protein
MNKSFRTTLPKVSRLGKTVLKTEGLETQEWDLFLLSEPINEMETLSVLVSKIPASSHEMNHTFNRSFHPIIKQSS